MVSDVFISYAAGDEPRASELAAALETKGWTVWWDRHIPPGRTFYEVIEQALTKARCVVVLRSAESVKLRSRRAARYLKVHVISAWGAGWNGSPKVVEWQLLGTL